VIATGTNPTAPIQDQLSGYTGNIAQYSCFQSTATSGTDRNWIYDLGQITPIDALVYIGPQDTADALKGDQVHFYVENNVVDRLNECASVGMNP